MTLHLVAEKCFRLFPTLKRLPECTLQHANLRNMVKNTLNECNQSPRFTALVSSPQKGIERLQEKVRWGKRMGFGH